MECRENGYLLSAKRIGSGAFSKVYLGYATPNKICQNYRLANDLRSKNHNMVAIKIISINDAPPEYSNKFLHREIYALNATYRHPGVIQLYDVFRSPLRFYLVLELALRGDLLEHINSVSRSKGSPGLSEDEARRVFKQIVNAVMHCHNSHIVHRDLKCENILLDEQGFVKLTDFGFANHSSDRRALMNTFCGSVAYTAPEILLSRKYNGEQADLWSLGVILFAMVTGKLPYQEKHPKKLQQQDLTFQTAVSSGVQDLIRKLLKWQPSCRLPLSQVNTHHWLLPPTNLLHKLRPTKSDITSRSHECPVRSGASARQHKDDEELPGMALSRGGVKGHSCHSGHVPPPSPTRRHPSLRNGPLRAPPPPSSPDGGRVEPSHPKPPHVTTCRLLLRPTQPLSVSPTRLFVSRHPRPPSQPRPFHNLPNFRKPGSAKEARSRGLAGKMDDGYAKNCLRTPSTG
ncbi:testis-specific serine/threonine-protein kinase 5-like [Osmerus mordax]|uniref:testis-specific serine/threonine-protein kinase 5-like n=1 Tax=Osmerus mordax TaxID=8014 RepID=UPI00350F6EBA